MLYSKLRPSFEKSISSELASEMMTYSVLLRGLYGVMGDMVKDEFNSDVSRYAK